eukprot:362317-Chlamydomonas_euryale.AAC.1
MLAQASTRLAGLEDRMLAHTSTRLAGLEGRMLAHASTRPAGLQGRMLAQASAPRDAQRLPSPRESMLPTWQHRGRCRQRCHASAAMPVLQCRCADAAVRALLRRRSWASVTVPTLLCRRCNSYDAHIVIQRDCAITLTSQSCDAIAVIPPACLRQTRRWPWTC